MSEYIKNDILRLIADRAPNWVRAEIIIRRLSQYNAKDVRIAIDELVNDSKLEKPLPSGPIEGELKIDYDAYGLQSYENIPVRKDIKVGETLVPRILKTDLIQVTLEDINEQIETLAEFSQSIGDQLSTQFKEEIRKQWGDLIALFGIFVAVFSFILVGLPRIVVTISDGFWKILFTNTAQVLPVAIVLAIFVYVLVKLFRSK